MGARNVEAALPPILERVRASGRRVLFVCDPMHGNGTITASGKKTRDYADISRELDATMDAHQAHGTRLGGVHFEMTGEDVTECIGGAAGITEADLDTAYETACDPRLNYRQSLEMAFQIARRLREKRPSQRPAR
jgi:3-deoxy-7-phosphoheptulonate synthase